MSSPRQTSQTSTHPLPAPLHSETRQTDSGNNDDSLPEAPLLPAADTLAMRPRYTVLSPTGHTPQSDQELVAAEQSFPPLEQETKITPPTAFRGDEPSASLPAGAEIVFDLSTTLTSAIAQLEQSLQRRQRLTEERKRMLRQMTELVQQRDYLMQGYLRLLRQNMVLMGTVGGGLDERVERDAGEGSMHGGE